MIQQLLAGTGINADRTLLDQIFVGSQGAFEPKVDEPIQDWMELLHDIHSMYPSGYKVDFQKLNRFGFQVTGVFQEMITGTCRNSNLEHRIYVCSEEATPAGCSCEASEGELPCEHSFHFVQWLILQLRSRNSEVCRRIEKRIFDIEQPKISDFRPDRLQQYRRQLQSVFSNLASVEPSANSDDFLPNLKEKQIGRIAWDFVVKDGGLSVGCYLQSPRKKGNGWNKGRKVALNRIGEFQNVLSSADQRVRQKISNSGYGFYDPRLQLSAFDAARELIGQPNVMIDGKPGTIREVSPMVGYRENETHCWLAIGKKNFRKFFRQSDYVELCTETATLGVAQLNSSQQTWLSAVSKLRKYPIELKSDLISHARLLRKVLSVKLPQEVDGQLVREKTKPVLLLRLTVDGSLDYVWLVRLYSGQLAKPGEGPMIRTDLLDGEQVQLQRAAKAERHLQRRLAKYLKLPPDETSGVISDFEAVLKLLQNARRLSCAAEKASSDTPLAAEGDLAGNSQANSGITTAKPTLEILWDEKSEKPVRLLGTVSPQNLRVGIQKSRDWFQLSGECDFGDKQVDFPTLLRSLNSVDSNSIHGDYVRLGDQGWAKISENLRKQLQRLGDSVNEERKQLVFDASSAKVINELVHHNIQVQATKEWSECLHRMESSRLLNPEVPPKLEAQLREYQREGFCWMRRLAEWGVGGVLADDMGLGKTLQALAVVLDRQQEGPTLVVAPTSIGFNWLRETERFAPDLKPHLYRETDREDFLASVAPGDLVICSYGLALRDAEKLSTIEWGTLILDEAQAVKNSRSKTATAIAGISAKWKLALTGTPVENHLGELWSVFRAVAPGVFGGWEQFRKRYAGPIERDQDEERRQALRDRLQPFVLRRTKKEVLKDLPPRTESNLVVELSPEEREVYNRVRLSAVGELDSIAKLSDIQDQRFRMLALLTRLRQLACSPKLVHPEWSGRSSKLQHLADTLVELRSEGHRCLVFSQFVTHLHLIREMLEEEKISYQYLDGSTTPVQRQQRVDAFQDGKDNVFLISLKAGGTGLNLTAADYVIHMDPWWNPAVEDQATDRAHRIGQDKPVMVYRMISQGTIEEEILKLHDSKRDLVAGVIDGSHAAAKLSTKDLMELIRG